MTRSLSIWQGWRDSNPCPPDFCPAGALPPPMTVPSMAAATPPLEPRPQPSAAAGAPPALDPPRSMAGVEGFEPPSPGFGVRCSSRSSYTPMPWEGRLAPFPLTAALAQIAPIFRASTHSRSSATTLLRFLVGRVLVAPLAELLELQAVRMRPLVLRRRVVPALAQCTRQRDDVAHGLLRDLRDHARPHRPPPLPNREPQLLLHRNRRDQLDRHRHVVPRHHHLHPPG